MKVNGLSKIARLFLLLLVGCANAHQWEGNSPTRMARNKSKSMNKPMSMKSMCMMMRHKGRTKGRGVSSSKGAKKGGKGMRKEGPSYKGKGMRIRAKFPTLFPKSGFPTFEPTFSLNLEESGEPSISPSGFPSRFPSVVPTSKPSSAPSSNPSTIPSALPSGSPSVFPSVVPTGKPSSAPSSNPSTMSSAEACTGDVMTFAVRVLLDFEGPPGLTDANDLSVLEVVLREAYNSVAGCDQVGAFINVTSVTIEYDAIDAFGDDINTGVATVVDYTWRVLFEGECRGCDPITEPILFGAADNSSSQNGEDDCDCDFPTVETYTLECNDRLANQPSVLNQFNVVRGTPLIPGIGGGGTGGGTERSFASAVTVSGTGSGFFLTDFDIELDIIGQAFLETYNSLSILNYAQCDPGERILTTVIPALVGPVEDTGETSVPFSIVFNIIGSCRNCGQATVVFGNHEPSPQDETATCPAGALLRCPTEQEFQTAFKETLERLESQGTLTALDINDLSNVEQSPSELIGRVVLYGDLVYSNTDLCVSNPNNAAVWNEVVSNNGTTLFDISRSRFTGSFYSSYNFVLFANYYGGLLSGNYDIHLSGILDADVLSGFRSLVIPAPGGGSYSSMERQVLREFVLNGGRLIFTADRTVIAAAAIAEVNSILADIGSTMAFQTDNTISSTFGGQVFSSSISTTSGSYCVTTGSEITLGPLDEVIATFGSSDQPVMAAGPLM